MVSEGRTHQVGSATAKVLVVRGDELAGKLGCTLSTPCVGPSPTLQSAAEIQSGCFSRFVTLSLLEKPILSRIESKIILVILLPFLDYFSPVTPIQFVSLLISILGQREVKPQWWESENNAISV